jgi:Na+/H+ antiporter NhaD/arsenite permease-like protein
MPILLLLVAAPAAAADAPAPVDLASHWAGILSLIIFAVAYALVISEEMIHLRKSKPVMVAAGLIWILVALTYQQIGQTEKVDAMIEHGLLEFVELFLFLLAAMTFINTMDERGVFDMLRSWLLKQNLTLRKLFWVTGALAFVMSPVADNLTTALLMATVVMAVGGSNRQFVVLGCINVVVAANSGGAFSPFGDITTLMVWQEEHVEFTQFFALVVPSLVNWLVTGGIMSLFIPADRPDAVDEEADIRKGAWVVVGLFIMTITMAVLSHTLLHLPPVVGMMTGLGILKIYGYYLQKTGARFNLTVGHVMNDSALSVDDHVAEAIESSNPQYDIYRNLETVEWDTLMFFYGIMLCVAGLGGFGYLLIGSDLMYGSLGATTANILVGFASAIFDNIPVMFAVLQMEPEMPLGQWLLITLTAGVGGSMLAIGSAAGVAVMGQARGIYTFFAHLKWSWAIVLGYAASIWTHLWLNADLF